MKKLKFKEPPCGVQITSEAKTMMKYHHNELVVSIIRIYSLWSAELVFATALKIPVIMKLLMVDLFLVVVLSQY